MLKQACLKSYQAARVNYRAPVFGLIDAAWAEANADVKAAADDEASANVARKFTVIFEGFASLNFWEVSELAMEADPVTGASTRRTIFGKRPALLAWFATHEAKKSELQARMDASREREAEQAREAIPALCLSRLREAGYDLTLDKQGRLCAAPGAVLDVGFGTDIYRDRKTEFVAILKAEAEAAAAEAKRLAPVPID
ncbi:hypothetical protein [Rhodopila sp.]|uniref:hypothetical protein n=1 Tax=Rhodopila sp. TaxID=2480087 RepID=UPI003D10E1D9